MLQADFVEAIVKGDSQRVVRLLGQITDTGPIKDGRNALHIAAQYGNTDIVSVLLLSGLYDCKLTDSIGYTALQIAAAEGYLDVVKQLIKSGSNVNAADNVHGNTALHEAAWKGYSRTVAELAKAKANLNLKNWGGFTALHLCCQNGHNQSCRELLLAACDPDVQNNYGDTPLHTSARYGHAGVMRILISAQCHVSDQNKNGDTALHIAAAMNRRKLTRILLECGCNKNVVNKQNETAEDIAMRKSHKEILDIVKNFSHAPKKVKSDEQRKTETTKQLEKRTNKNRSSHKKKVKPAAAINNSDSTQLTPWSPYGCHNFPDNTDFPEPNLDSLPNEPLRKGEQYYLDLAGNIRKGPVGIGYACYCAPFFHELESRIEKRTKKLQKQIHRTENAVNKRLNTIEYCLHSRNSPKRNDSQRHRENAAGCSLVHARSFESIFDENGSGSKDEAQRAAINNNDLTDDVQFDKRKNILFLRESCDKTALSKLHDSDCSSPCCQQDSMQFSAACARKQYYSSCSLDASIRNTNLWKNSRLENDSCESSDEECEKATDIPCNDSGYSTKMCSNSQGPSPSLSGRLENDGLLSVTPSHEETRPSEMSSFMSTFKTLSVKQASIV